VVAVGKQLLNYGLNPETHQSHIMIEYDQLGLMCEFADGEDIDLKSRSL